MPDPDAAPACVRSDAPPEVLHAPPLAARAADHLLIARYVLPLG